MSGRLSAKQLAQALGPAKQSGKGFTCLCPAHDDHRPSLYVEDGENGRLILKCHAGCGYPEVVAALNSRGLWGNAPSRNDADARKGRVVSPVPPDAPGIDWTALSRTQPTYLYAYRDADGGPLHYVARWDHSGGSKDIRPVVFIETIAGQRRWAMQGVPEPRPLYGLDLLAARPGLPVLVVEGEKTADAARRLLPSHVAVTWSGGAANVLKADWTPLRGRDVVLWPDHDEPGRKAMGKAAEKLQALAKSVRLVSLPADLDAHWDLADEHPAGLDIHALLSSAKPVHVGLRQHILTASELIALPIPPQEFLIEPWLPKGALAMVWAARGLGKTWFALSLAIALASGTRFLEYGVPKPVVVLFVDGEMALAELQERVRKLADPPPERLHILPSERLFAEGAPLNINDPADQQKVIDAIDALAAEGVKPGLIILDNLSSLAAGLDENDNSALDGMTRWMVRMRHSGVTVLLVHHASKAGEQRGASRREDQLNTAIKLGAPENKAGLSQGHEGAHFIMEFTKTRGRRPKPMVMELRLVELPTGRLDWLMSSGTKVSPRDQVLRYIAEHKPMSQDEIGIALERAKGTISKDCAALESEGFITKSPPRATPKGIGRVLALWPDLYSTLARQDDLPI